MRNTNDNNDEPLWDNVSKDEPLKKGTSSASLNNQNNNAFYLYLNQKGNNDKFEIKIDNNIL